MTILDRSGCRQVDWCSCSTAPDSDEAAAEATAAVAGITGEAEVATTEVGAADTEAEVGIMVAGAITEAVTTGEGAGGGEAARSSFRAEATQAGTAATPPTRTPS